MDGIYFLAALAAIIALLRWYIRCDVPGKDEIAKGFFGMRDTPTARLRSIFNRDRLR